MKKTEKMNPHTFFQPTFGNCPDQYIGRDGDTALSQAFA